MQMTEGVRPRRKWSASESQQVTEASDDAGPRKQRTPGYDKAGEPMTEDEDYVMVDTRPVVEEYVMVDTPPVVSVQTMKAPLLAASKVSLLEPVNFAHANVR